MSTVLGPKFKSKSQSRIKSRIADRKLSGVFPRKVHNTSGGDGGHGK